MSKPSSISMYLIRDLTASSMSFSPIEAPDCFVLGGFYRDSFIMFSVRSASDISFKHFKSISLSLRLCLLGVKC